MYKCFGIKDGCHVPLETSTLQTYQDALNESFVNRQAAFNEAEIKLSVCRAKVNAANGARKQHIELELPVAERALKNTFFYLRSKTKTLTADGGDTNGELTRETAIVLIRRLINKHGLSATSVLMDGGANYNLFAALAAQLAGCRAFGIEFVTVRTFVAASTFLAAMSDKKRKGCLVNELVAYVTCDLLNLRSIDPATHAYFFDEAFDAWLVEHNIKVCANTLSITHICSFKALANTRAFIAFLGIMVSRRLTR
jgi:hypothetical protein